jgi:tetratricopeptide (TPR) repeat protein
MTQRRLAWASGGLALSRLQAVYALSAAGILQDADAALAAASQPIVQMETGTFLLSALRRAPDPSGQDAIRLEVEDELERSAHLDKEKWLKVASSAPRDELVRALEEKMERYHALREAVGEEEQIKTDIEVILGRASAMLRLARQAPLPASSPPEERVTSPAALAPEASTARPALESAGAPGSSTFEGQAKVEHLLMEGEVRMTVSDYANAVTVYEKLVQIAPKIPSYRVHLAIAMACYPRTAKQAEREFLEALRLDADNADIHYQFGLYYKAMKQRSRAVAEMRTAVRLNPRHAMAREELESLSPKDSALTSLKKLFK